MFTKKPKVSKKNLKKSIANANDKLKGINTRISAEGESASLDHLLTYEYKYYRIYFPIYFIYIFPNRFRISE